MCLLEGSRPCRKASAFSADPTLGLYHLTLKGKCHWRETLQCMEKEEKGKYESGRVRERELPTTDNLKVDRPGHLIVFRFTGFFLSSSPNFLFSCTW